MEVHREEKSDGTLLRLVFLANHNEDTAALKAAVRDWLAANHPMGWEEFFTRCSTMAAGRLVLEMT